MTIPIDNLYHYIENIAQEIYKDNVIIYRFYPHGSKNINNQVFLKDCSWVDWATSPHLYCYDQEPLNYDMYSNCTLSDIAGMGSLIQSYQITLPHENLRIDFGDIYDKCILLHSEKNSINEQKYRDNVFIPVYYWSHALIAQDWYRFSKYQSLPAENKNPTKKFLIYNRAWSGTREYRLKFMDLLIEHNLVNSTMTTCNSIEPELQYHYLDHTFKNILFKPKHNLEDYYKSNHSGSTASATIDIEDYKSTDFEIVLETLFDDSRHHLTEKIFRPIAVGQPFILVSTAGSLDYLKSYGFKTFDSIIDESYDSISDPVARLTAIVKVMKDINSWDIDERNKKLEQVKTIVEFNKKYFHSKEFFNLVVSELKQNLAKGLKELEDTNTSQRFFNRRKIFAKFENLKSAMLADYDYGRNRKDAVKVVKKARKYYNKYLHAQKNIN